MKIDLIDSTFLIPIKVDSIIRIENILATVNYIVNHFNTNLIVLEVGAFNNGILNRLLNRSVKYLFIEDKDPIFHRTKYRNLLANLVETPFLAIWDADVIVDKKQILEAITKLRENKADIAYPYDGRFYDTSIIIRHLFLIKKKISVLHKYVNRMSLPYSNTHKGGAFIANTEKFKLAGMENEEFYGWGPEDFERFERWKNLNYNIYFSKGCLYHLTHPRDKNGRYNSKRQMEITNTELIKTKRSSADEIKNRLKCNFED